MPNEILTRAIDAVASGNHLTTDHAAAVLSEIMEGRASEVQTGAFLIALRTKGETVPELVGLARTMRELATPVNAKRDDLVDTAGTGGGPSTFNVSTTAAIVAAGAGGIDQVVASGVDGRRQLAHGPGQADQLRHGLALGPQRDQECAGLDLGSASLHDLGEDGRGVVGGQVVARSDRVDRPGQDLIRQSLPPCQQVRTRRR